MTPPVNTRRVMVRRHHGWEGASTGLLARIFGVSVQQASAIVAQRCSTCGKLICGCTDADWACPPRRAVASSRTHQAPLSASLIVVATQGNRLVHVGETTDA